MLQPLWNIRCRWWVRRERRKQSPKSRNTELCGRESEGREKPSWCPLRGPNLPRSSSGRWTPILRFWRKLCRSSEFVRTLLKITSWVERARRVQSEGVSTSVEFEARAARVDIAGAVSWELLFQEVPEESRILDWSRRRISVLIFSGRHCRRTGVSESWRGRTTPAFDPRDLDLRSKPGDTWS